MNKLKSIGIVLPVLAIAALAAITAAHSRTSIAAPRNTPTTSGQAAPQSAPQAAPQAATARVERGRYLVLTSACNDCHTPLKAGANGPEPDMARMLSGHPEQMKLQRPKPGAAPWSVSVAATNTAWAGPWGVSFPANLTPDTETGLGAWSEAEFIATIHSGRHLGRGRTLLPPMPIPAYSNFNDDDLRAIFAYLRSIPAVKNHVPAPIPPVSPNAR
jgi:mono/diheme cytochrome c family protein